MNPISNQIHPPVRPRSQKVILQLLEKNIYPVHVWGKKKNSTCPGEIAPGTQLGHSHHLCSLAPWKQELEDHASQKCQKVLQL